MMRAADLPLPLLCATVLTLSCAPSSAPEAAEAGAPAAPSSAPSSALAAPSSSAGPVAVPAALEADLLAIAASYASMSRADGTWWSPEDCKAPVHPTFVSKAEAGAHGRKLYTLFVKDIASYAALSGRTVAVERGLPVEEVKAMSQVIVKEAWTPIESSKWEASCRAAPGSGLSMPSFLAPVVMNDGKEYRACEPAGLFVMYRPAVAGDDSDDGWVYGTVQYEKRAAEPKVGEGWIIPRVTSAGRVANCMGCHTRAPHGRLFGLPSK